MKVDLNRWHKHRVHKKWWKMWSKEKYKFFGNLGLIENNNKRKMAGLPLKKKKYEWEGFF